MQQENNKESTPPDTGDDRSQESLAPEFLKTIPAAEPADISMAIFAPADTPPSKEAQPGDAQERVRPPQGFDILIRAQATQHIKHLVLVVGTLLALVAVGLFVGSRRSA